MSCIFEAESDPAIVGSKAANLALLAAVPGISIPPYFVVSTVAFDRVSERSRERISLLDDLADDNAAIPGIGAEIRNDILTAALPVDIAAAISSSYREFSQRQGEKSALVSVRSSATAEDGTGASFAGQYATFLNIRGKAALLAAVRQVWASTYSTQVILYRKKNGYTQGTTSMAVIIQQMVAAKSAGTIYTVDPETGAALICINAVPGLGLADVAGELTPTSWIVDPQTLTVMKRRRASEGGDPPLDSSYLLEVARQVNRVSAHFRDNLQIPVLEAEFAFARDGQLFFTQVRPETVWSNGRASLTAVDLNRAAHFLRIFEGGMTGSPGVSSGILRVVSCIEEAEAVAQAGAILVTPNTTNIWERVLNRIGGIITGIGGTGSHTAVVMRESGKPALVGVGVAIQALRQYDNTLVTLDATQRIVFAGREAATVVHHLQTVTPVYGTADCQSEEESWFEAASLPGRTEIDAAGARWICKPEYPVSRFMQLIYRNSHRWIGRRLCSTINNEIRQNIHRVSFRDVYQWRLRLRAMTLTELEELHLEREQAVADYLAACSSFALQRNRAENWLMSYLKLNAFIGLGFDIYKVTEGLLEEVLAQQKVVEPYYSQIRTAHQESGEMESSCCARSLHSLVIEARGSRRLLKALAAAGELQCDAPLKAAMHFYTLLESHVCKYKVTCRAEIDLPLSTAVLAVVAEILRLVEADLPPCVATDKLSTDKSIEYFPYDLHLQRVHRLALNAEKVRQDAHHLRVRGHWLVRDKLEQLADFLIAKGQIGSFAELFAHSPVWLVRQVALYEANNLNGRRCFHG